MAHSNPSIELQERIESLKLQAQEERHALKEELMEIASNINPVRLITNGIKEVITSPEVKDGLFSLTLGMSAGYIAKKIVIGNSNNPIQLIAGNIVGMFVSKSVSLRSEEIRENGLSILQGIFSNNSNKSKEE